MEEKLEIGDFGQAHFPFEKKDFKGGIRAFGKIVDLDGKYVLFVDNEDYPYLVRKDKFEFIKQKFVINKKN